MSITQKGDASLSPTPMVRCGSITKPYRSAPYRTIRNNAPSKALVATLQSTCGFPDSRVRCLLVRWSVNVSRYYFLSFLYINRLNVYVPAQLVRGATFWTSRGHRCPPFSPPVHASIFIAHSIGFSIPTARRFFHRSLPTRALVLL